MRNTNTRQMMPHPRVINALFGFTAALLLAAMVTACATTSPGKIDIKDRAQARWDAVLTGDLDTAYSFYSPGYRSSTSRVDFEISLRMRRVRWISAEVQESSCVADVCTVSTLLGYQVARPVPSVTVWKNKKLVDETWVRTEGKWWFLPSE